MRLILFVCLIAGLSSCILTQEPPKSPTQGEGNVLGALLLENTTTKNSQSAQFEGLFLAKVDENVSLKLSGVGLSNRIFISGIGATSFLAAPSTDCRYYPATREKNERVAYLPAGTIGFGLSGSNLQEVKPDSQNRYKALFSGHFSSGSYVIKVGGSNLVPGFSTGVILPETLKGVRLNGVSFVENEFTLTKNAAITLSWDKALFPNDDHWMAIIVEDAASGSELQCVVRESELTGSAQLQWVIDPIKLKDLPAMNAAQIDVIRVLAVQAEDEKLQVLLQGSDRQTTVGRVE